MTEFRAVEDHWPGEMCRHGVNRDALEAGECKRCEDAYREDETTDLGLISADSLGPSPWTAAEPTRFCEYCEVRSVELRTNHRLAGMHATTPEHFREMRCTNPNCLAFDLVEAY